MSPRLPFGRLGPRTRRLSGATIGLILGTAVGFYLTVTIFVAQARAGHYVYSLDDLARPRWQMLPTAGGVVVGLVLGWRAFPLLVTTLGAMVGGAAVLIPLGWFVGGLIWVGDSGPWAGAVLASGVGVLLGAFGLWLHRRRRRSRSG